MNTQIPFYVFSVQRSELSEEENRGRVGFVRTWLKRAGIRAYPVVGRYKGEEESSFIVFDNTPGSDEMRRHVLNIANLYEQESILHVDANGLAYLYSSTGALLSTLGMWREIPAEQAAQLEAVTQTADGRYWSAGGAA